MGEGSGSPLWPLPPPVEGLDGGSLHVIDLTRSDPVSPVLSREKIFPDVFIAPGNAAPTGLLTSEQVFDDQQCTEGNSFLSQIQHEFMKSVKFPGYYDRQNSDDMCISCGYESKLVFYPPGPFSRECPMVQLTYSERKGRNVCALVWVLRGRNKLYAFRVSACVHVSVLF